MGKCTVVGQDISALQIKDKFEYTYMRFWYNVSVAMQIWILHTEQPSLGSLNSQGAYSFLFSVLKFLIPLFLLHEISFIVGMACECHCVDSALPEIFIQSFNLSYLLFYFVI